MAVIILPLNLKHLQAAAVAATYSVRNPYPQTGYVVRLFEVPNGDDTVTLKANIRMRGTHVIVR